MSEHTSGTFDARERVLVIGLGRSGQASAAVLRARGATVFATDENSSDALREAIGGVEAKGVTFVSPDDLETLFGALTAAVVSPGIPINGALVRRVQAARIPVFSEIEVAYRIGRAPIVAITGTKGKTTTTALIGEMFRRAGKRVFVGGNIGNPLIAETAVAGAEDWVVAEVSSFQLESIRSFKPRISAILNLSPDHLDRYHSMDEYTEAKLRIFANQGPGDTFVGNLDDPRIGILAEGEEASRIPTRAVWFSTAPHRASTLYVRGASIIYAPPKGDPRPVHIMDVGEIPLAGGHNVENVMAALLVGLSAGLEANALRSAVQGFAGLRHRLERVDEIDGILYVNDSKATNPGSVIAALNAFDRPIVLIAGGKAKGTDFQEMGSVVAQRTRGVVLIGEAADEIAAVISGVPVQRARSLAEAVRVARESAQRGDVVLLSPGCASFDMFSSAEERGQRFIDAVRAPQEAHHGA